MNLHFRRVTRARIGRWAMLLLGGIAPFLATASAPAGESYAFLVGVAEYDKKELKPLQFTRSDILELNQVLVDSGYSKSNIVLMHDDLKQLSSRRFFPEAAKIREELRLLLAGLEKDDSLIVAFSGHGVQFKGQKQNYFCPADAKLDDRNTLIALSDLYSTLEKCPARQKLLLVDACRDDPQSQLGKARQSVDLESVTRPQTEAVPEGLVALFSCAAGQRSFEDPDLKHGVFFYHVLEGLKGEARNTDNEVTLDDLVSFTRKRTQTFARTSLAAIQTPQQLGDFTGTWVLRSVNATTPAKPPVKTPDSTTPSRPPVTTPTSTPPVAPSKSGPLVAGTKAGEMWDGNQLKMKFCWCPDGDFVMGSPADEPGHYREEDQVNVSITGFWLGKYEVTYAEWKAVMGAKYSEDETKGSTHYGEGPNHPARGMKHDEATLFATKYTEQERAAGRLPAGWEYRLPTEAQWEYACRAGTKTRYSCGDDDAVLERHAWLSSNSEQSTHAVGEKLPNAWGLHDMHGNVWEWCRNWYTDELIAGRDPESRSATAVKAFRGGSWRGGGVAARSAARGRYEPEYTSNDRGLRLAAVRVSK